MRVARGLALTSVLLLSDLTGSAAQPGAASVMQFPVTVTHDGASVRGLTMADFAVTEDGQPVAVQAVTAESIPLSVAIIIDTGPMMRGPWMGDTFSAVHQLLTDVLGPEDEASLYVFGREPLLLQKWAKRDTVLTSRYRVPDGAASPLYDALARASIYTDEAKHARRAVIVVTGGAVSDGWRRQSGPAFAPPIGATTATPSLALNGTNPWEPSAERERALKELRNRSLLLYAIGLETPRPSDKKLEPPPPVNTQELRDVSEQTGGYLRLVEAPERIADAVNKLKDELRNQYLLSYVPPRGADGKYHEVRVTVKHPDYRVRVRQNYLASKDKR